MRDAAAIHLLPDHLVLQDVFAECFWHAHHTRLCGGAEEPFYQAATGGAPAKIHYRADYAASALHEVAHWCIAGAERRQQDDYGYWYAADGRDEALQQVFERVEYKPQALELLFSVACGRRFRVSVDNLALPDYDSTAFATRVTHTAVEWYQRGIPPRAQCFLGALSRRFGYALVADEDALLQQLLMAQAA